MSDTEREALARLLRAVAAVEKMLPHGPDRYELLVAAQAIAAALAAEREAAEARVAEQAREIERLRPLLQRSVSFLVGMQTVQVRDLIAEIRAALEASR